MPPDPNRVAQASQPTGNETIDVSSADTRVITVDTDVDTVGSQGTARFACSRDRSNPVAGAGSQMISPGNWPLRHPSLPVQPAECRDGGRVPAPGTGRRSSRRASR